MTKKTEDTTVLVHLYDLIERGFNLIPVYQADDPRINTNGVPVAKTPHVSWKQYKTELVTKELVTTWYRQFPDCAWAILCGVASGDLFVIDFDDPSIYESHFSEWSKRTFVVQTPSGGYHAYFRISPCPPNTNKYKALYDIDTRGEGGYVLAPVVSKGYTIISKTEKIAQMTDLDSEIDVWEKLDIQDDYYDLARIRSEVSVLDMVRHFGDSGGDPIHNNSKIKCPFHDDKNPSMSLHPHRFKCFGCDAQGSALDYVMLKLQTHDVTLAAKAIEKIINTEYRMTAPTQPAAGTNLHNIPDQSELAGDIEQDERRINIRPEGFISEYMNYGQRLTDAYPEYHYMGALTTLSMLAKRKRPVVFLHRSYYPVIYSMLLGPSTISMKTQAMNLVRSMIDSLPWGIDSLLPNFFTMEGYFDLMSMNSERIIVNDEAGGFLKNMKKKYMQDMQDVLCNTFDERTLTRKLRTSKDGDPNLFTVHEPFLDIIFATVPTTIRTITDSSDVDSGWMVRFLFAYPRYARERDAEKWFQAAEVDDGIEESHPQLVESLESIDAWLDATRGHPMDVEPAVYTRLRSWRNDVDKRIEKHTDDRYGAIMGRLSDYVVKLSMLHAISRMSDTITTTDLENAIEVVDEFFAPCAMEIFGTIVDFDTDFMSKRIVKIIEFLRTKNGRATRREILRKTHLKSKELDENVATMAESGALRVEEKTNVNGEKTLVYHLQKEA